MTETEEVLECDFLVVGAGVSGCSLASELVRNGLSVVLLENGKSSAPSHPYHKDASRWWLSAAASPFARSSFVPYRPKSKISSFSSSFAFYSLKIIRRFTTEPQASLDNRVLPVAFTLTFSSVECIN